MLTVGAGCHGCAPVFSRKLPARSWLASSDSTSVRNASSALSGATVTADGATQDATTVPNNSGGTMQIHGVSVEAESTENLFTLTVAGAQHQVGPDVCARFSGGLPHKYANDGDTPAELTMVVVIPPTDA